MRTFSKRVLSLTLLFLLAAALLSGSGYRSIQAEEERQYVFDDAGIFSASELERLQEQAESMREKKKADILIFYTAQGLSEEQLVHATDSFYDLNEYGYEDAHGTGIMLAVDVRSRVYYVSTSGGCYRYFSDDLLYRMENAFVPYLARSDWYGAGQKFISEMEDYRDPAVPVTFAEKLQKNAQRLPMILILGFGAGTLITLIMAKNHGDQSTVSTSSYLEKGSFSLVQQDDVLINDHTTRVRVRDNNVKPTGGAHISMGNPFSGSGGHSIGGGGGHTSGGGFTHGGHSGKF